MPPRLHPFSTEDMYTSTMHTYYMYWEYICIYHIILYVCGYVCVHVYMCVYTYIHMYVDVYIYIHIYIYAHVCMYMYIGVCKYVRVCKFTPL